MKIRKEHTLGLDEARRRVDAVADDLKGKFSLQSRWEGDHLKVSGNGVNGHIAILHHAVEVNVKLGFALLLLKETIRSTIEETMNKHLS